MKQVTLTLAEFFLFKEIAHFIYEFSVNNSFITIKADAHQLELLGY
jgi:hypothetical protein